MSSKDILILLMIAALCILSLRKILRDKKRGRTCCGDCSRCSSICPHEAHKEETK